MISSVGSQGPMWAKKLIRYKMDNQAFQKSAVKGWSRADRLNLLLKRLIPGSAGQRGAGTADATEIAGDLQYPRASLYNGLPVDLLEAADELMSNRLAPSSMATVNIAFERYWTPLADEHGWPGILETDDPERGGKMAAFVLRLLDDTNLVADSIQSYVWGLRWKMKLEHQADPVLGVMHWQEFMRSVAPAHVRIEDVVEEAEILPFFSSGAPFLRLFCQATERPIIRRKMLARRQLAPGGIVITAVGRNLVGSSGFAVAPIGKM